MDSRKIWLIKPPFDQYNQDVKALARQNHLVIYDEKFRDVLNKARFEKKPPRLTKKGTQKRVPRKVEAEVEEVAAEDTGE